MEEGSASCFGHNCYCPHQQLTIHYAADIAGYALSVGEVRKVWAHFNDCRDAGISFIPLVVESFDGWNVKGLDVIEYVGKLQGLWLGLQTLCHKEPPFSVLVSCAMVEKRNLWPSRISNIPSSVSRVI